MLLSFFALLDNEKTPNNDSKMKAFQQSVNISATGTHLLRKLHKQVRNLLCVYIHTCIHTYIFGWPGAAVYYA